MYRNLEAELRRKGITRAKLAEALGINIATVSEKLTKPNRLWLYEALEIQRIYFPDMEISYLFEQEQVSA
ncbi:MAG: hypothetical protein A2Y17_12160 [Clostridiales bacterium GWF2_38_85]|nr:MAG: hypothetical protein A2Y17_12160 [Clostridiales bacterium GWF2_38_85]